MTSSKTALIQAKPKVQNTDVLSTTMPMINRMRIEEKSGQTIKSYIRGSPIRPPLKYMAKDRIVKIREGSSID